LRLQSNASVATRDKLDHLTQLTGALWETLVKIHEEAKAITSTGLAE